MEEPKKKSHTPHPLSVRLEVVRRSESGEKRGEICKAMSLPFTTVYDWTRNAEAIKTLGRKAGIYSALPGKVRNDANKVLGGNLGKIKGPAPKRVKLKAFSATVNRKKPPPFSMYSVKTKLGVLKRLKKGDSVMDVSEALKVPRSTVYEMRKYSDEIMAQVQKAHALKIRKRINAAATTTTTAAATAAAAAVLPSNASQYAVGNPEKFHKKGTQHSLPAKLDIVRRAERGEKMCDISRATGVPQSTVHYILKRARSNNISNTTTTTTTTPAQVQSAKESKDVVMENMERLLKIWLDEQLSQPSSLTDDAIRKKALSLWRFVKDSLGPEETQGPVKNFNASLPWLAEFKSRFISMPVAASETRPATENQAKTEIRAKTETKTKTDPQSKTEVRAFSHTLSPKCEIEALYTVEKRVGLPKGVCSLLKAKIEVGRYTPRQVINLDELGLCWKKPPSNTIVSVDERDCLRARDQFSLMLGTNATGDLKLKPLLVYHTENPYSLMGYIKELLPVVWRSHPRGKVVSTVCQNYVVDYISQRCKEYATEHNLQNRFLLLVDNSSAFPPSMDDWADNIEVMFVPTMSQSVVQPMENGIATAFKLRYFYHLLDHLIRETEGEDKESVRRAWQNYNIKKAVNNIKMAWDGIQPSTLNAAWGSIWPECVNDPSFAVTDETTDLDVMALAHQAGFLEVTLKDIHDLLKNPDEENASEDFFQAELYHAMQIHGEETEIVKTLDVTLLSHVLSLFNEAMAVLEDNDPNCTRSCDMRSLVEQGIRSYRELYATKKRKAQDSSIFYPSS